MGSYGSSGSFKVNGNATIQWTAYGFLLVTHSECLPGNVEVLRISIHRCWKKQFGGAGGKEQKEP